ncbi:hypothetical protein K0M31_015912 [Melipona bicolor]|uniref:Uncharacterized protein n=1 Tax=Melipona bicolor TaxID=60889 RepID=A0AA40G5Y6_9HYME|nr:hypothetical protein K0M31_015912 [Melipona bicolor]
MKKDEDNSDEHREAAVANAICGEPQQGSTSIIRSSSQQQRRKVDCNSVKPQLYQR